MFQELLHFFSIIFCVGGLAMAIIGILWTVAGVVTPWKFQAVLPFISMILGGLLMAVIGAKGLTLIPTPKSLQIQAPADSVIRAEVIRNGQVIHQEEI